MRQGVLLMGSLVLLFTLGCEGKVTLTDQLETSTTTSPDVNDTVQDEDTQVPPQDTQVVEDTTPVDTTPELDTTPSGCDRNDATWRAFGFEAAFFNADNPNTANEDESNLLYLSDTSFDTPFDGLEIAFYYGSGAPKDSTFSHTFTGENFDSCGVCLLGYEDCGNTECNRSFLAQSGTISVTSQGDAGANFTGTLSNIVFVEVEIDKDTFESTPVQDGRTWCLGRHDFDITLQ